MDTYQYQDDYAASRETMYEKKSREDKAKKIYLVLKDYLKRGLKDLVVLDIGCSTGIIDNFLAPYFKKVVAIDIDKEAVAYAKSKKHPRNVTFKVADAMNLPFEKEAFDIILCAHVYEHVPDASRLFLEIYRLLKKDGVCYLAATNKLQLVEPHYNLPFLSLLPRRLAHLYVRTFTNKNKFYEKPLTYWQLRQLLQGFTIIDYTQEIFKNPKQFGYSFRFQPLFKVISQFAIFLSPTFIWLLKK